MKRSLQNRKQKTGSSLHYSTTLQHYTTVQHYSTALQHNTTVQHYSTTLQHNTTVQHYSTLQYNTTVQHYSTTLHYNTTVQHYSTTLQHNTTVQHYSTLQYNTTVQQDPHYTTVQHYSTTLHYNTTLQHYTTTLQYNTTVQHYSTTGSSLHYITTELSCLRCSVEPEKDQQPPQASLRACRAAVMIRISTSGFLGQKCLSAVLTDLSLRLSVPLATGRLRSLGAPLGPFEGPLSADDPRWVQFHRPPRPLLLLMSSGTLR